MKQALDNFYRITAIALCSISSNFVAVKSAQALEEGLYWGGGSRYITIVKKANTGQKGDRDRFCYQGFSNNGSLVASLKLTIPRYQTGMDYEIYSLQGSALNTKTNLAVQQFAFKRDEITFGSLVGRFVRGGMIYKREGDVGAQLSPELQECLNSRKPYFKQILSGRDRR